MYLDSLATESLVERFSLLNSSVLRVEKFQTSLPVHVGCCCGASSTEQHDQSAFVFWRPLSIQLPSSPVSLPRWISGEVKAEGIGRGF
jgi:hypothetical protein